MRKEALITVLVAILLFGVIGVGIYFGFTSQSILSLSNVNVGNDGQVYWVYTGSANKPNENYVFREIPNEYVTPSGTQVEPQSELIISVSRSNGKCVYEPIKIERFLAVDYYIFENPEKVVDVTFTDNRNNMKTIDGTRVTSVAFEDVDGDGEVTIETQGLLSGKYDCPGVGNVAMVKDGDGRRKFVYKSEIEDISIDLFGLLRENTQFTSTFKAFQINSKDQVTGDIEIGNVVFTITADQGYFDSTTFIPASNVDPEIDKINVPRTIKQDGSSSMTVDIVNNNDNVGLIDITTESDTFSIQPSAINEELDDEVTVGFTIKAPDVTKEGEIKVTVCSVNQFSSDTNCDSNTVDVEVVSNTPAEYCGDGICQANEDMTTCSQDCQASTTPQQNFECKWYQDYATTKFLLFNSEGCRLSLWIVVVGVILMIVIIGGVILFIKSNIPKIPFVT